MLGNPVDVGFLSLRFDINQDAVQNHLAWSGKLYVLWHIGGKYPGKRHSFLNEPLRSRGIQMVENYTIFYWTPERSASTLSRILQWVFLFFRWVLSPCSVLAAQAVPFGSLTEMTLLVCMIVHLYIQLFLEFPRSYYVTSFSEVPTRSCDKWSSTCWTACFGYSDLTLLSLLTAPPAALTVCWRDDVDETHTICGYSNNQ